MQKMSKCIAEVLLHFLNFLSVINLLSLSFFFSDGCSDSDKQDLLSELNIMKCLPQHANVIQLLGYVTRTGINYLAICDKYKCYK